MKVYSRPINTGETFCTSIKAAKSLFENTDVKLCFGEFRRQYNPYTNEFGFGYYKKNIYGTVVATMTLEPNVKCALISFYILKPNTFSMSLKTACHRALLTSFHSRLFTVPFSCESIVTVFLFQ